MANLAVDLVAADRTVWSGEATMVSAPASDGEIGILVGHSPVLAVLRAGTVRIHGLDGSVQQARVDGGFLSVDKDQVTIVVDSAETPSAPGAAR